MKFRMRDIENFEATVSCSTMGEASRKLGISQPALTESIQQIGAAFANLTISFSQNDSLLVELRGVARFFINNMLKFSPRQAQDFGEGMFTLKNNSGMTLLEAVISLGISAILMSATASMFLSQQKENKALQQKLETVDLKNQIMQGFINPNNCTWQLSGKTFNTTGVTATNPSSTVISLTELRQGPNASSFLIAATGQPVPGTQTKLAVHSVTFKEIFATGNPNEYKGIFEISFTPSSMVRVIQSVRYNQIITAIGSPTASITACGAPSNDFKLGGFYTWHRHYGYCVYVNPMTGACSCPVGYTARFYNRIGYDDGTKTDDRDMGYCYKM